MKTFYRIHSEKLNKIEFDKLGNFKVCELEKNTPKQQRTRRIECITLDDEDNYDNAGLLISNQQQPIVNPFKKPKLEVLGNCGFAPILKSI